MRIALVSPLYETVPPRKYGGTERVMHFMVEELVRLGHDVDLYACRGSETSARLIECWHGTFRDTGVGPLPEHVRDPYYAQLKQAFNGNYDIVHVHHGSFNYHADMVEELAGTVPIVWTDHGKIHDNGTPDILRSLGDLNIGFTALSDSHRNTVPDANWLATIHHGLPINLLTPTGAKPEYLAFLGRISPEKGIETAVRIAAAAGMPLKVAAKVDNTNLEYYEQIVKPLFDEHNVDYIGEINEQEKRIFLSGATAMIFPICWLEPFGLVMIEAMACGCPTIAFKVGSVGEIIDDGVTGFTVDNEQQAIEAVKKIPELDRKQIRNVFERKFTSTVMAQKYVDVYRRVIEDTTSSDTDESLDESVFEAVLLQAGDPYLDERMVPWKEEPEMSLSSKLTELMSGMGKPWILRTNAA